MRKIILFVLLAAFALAAHANAQAPDWYTSGEIDDYNRDAYFLGAGKGNSFKEAQAEAQAAIAAQLRVSIESSVEVFKRESSYDGDSSVSEHIRKNTKSTIDETIQGAEVVEQERAGGDYYAFAVLDKVKFFNGLRSELERIESQIREALDNARSNMNGGNIHSAVESYSDAYEKTLSYFSKKGFLEGLTTTPVSFDFDVSPAEVTGEIREVLSSIELHVLSGENQSAEMGKMLPDPVVFEVIYNPQDGGEVTVSNMQITVRGEKNEILDKISTNSRGQAQLYVKAVPQQGNRGEVRARLNISSMSARFKDFIRSPEVQVAYSVEERGPIATSLQIETEEGRTIRRLEQNVARYLNRLDFKVADKAPLRIEGVVRKIGEQEVSGFSGTQYRVDTELVLELYLTSSGEKISSAVFRGSGMSPRGPEDALQAAYTRVNLNSRKITDLMSGAAEKVSGE